MSVLFIENNVNFHYEIIESIILNYNKIIKNEEIHIIFLSILNNDSFEEYIKNKYPNIYLSIPSNFDYYISATIYDNDYNNLNKNSKKHFYISHEVTERLTKHYNIYFLTPLGNNNNIISDKLPYIENTIKKMYRFILFRVI